MLNMMALTYLLAEVIGEDWPRCVGEMTDPERVIAEVRSLFVDVAFLVAAAEMEKIGEVWCL